MISESDYERLREKYEKICIHKEIKTRLCPLEAYERARRPFSFLLETSEFDKTSKYSFLGISREHALLKGKSIEALKKFVEKKVYVEEGMERFVGGIVGFVSYDMARQFERLPCMKAENSFPDALFLVSDDCMVFDHKSNTKCIMLTLDNHEDYECAERRMKALEDALRGRPRLKKERHFSGFFNTTTKEEYEEMVVEAKKHILAGDIFQVVLSRRIEAKIEADPVHIYEALKRINPSPYMYLLDFGDLSVIGSSPELLVRLEGKEAHVRPLAGTRGRGKTTEEDERLERELLSDEKEKAEHVMLVDLGRNDLGRVCEYGSVEVKEFMSVEKYSHVQHIVSNVSGRLREDMDAFDLFRATFPAGTVSGAPKIRAMEIIEKLEKERRGVYAGGVGYFSYNGDMDFAITIRTFFMERDRIFAQAGAGIVADSDPEKEFLETERKLGALKEALTEAVA